MLSLLSLQLHPNRPLSAMYGLYCPPGIQQFFSWIKERVSAAPSAAPPPEDAADPVPPPPIPLGHRAGGIQGGPPPCAGGPGTRRSLAYLCLLSLREKVGRGAGRSARSWGGVQRMGRQPLLARGDGPQPSGERSPVSLRKSRSFIKIYNLFISLLDLCYIMKRTKELS